VTKLLIGCCHVKTIHLQIDSKTVLINHITALAIRNVVSVLHPVYMYYLWQTRTLMVLFFIDDICSLAEESLRFSVFFVMW